MTLGSRQPSQQKLWNEGDSDRIKRACRATHLRICVILSEKGRMTPKMGQRVGPPWLPKVGLLHWIQRPRPLPRANGTETNTLQQFMKSLEGITHTRDIFIQNIGCF